MIGGFPFDQLFVINLCLAGGMLLYTSYLDMRKREVEDKVWIIFGVAGGLLQGFEVATGQASLLYLAISLGLAAGIGMGLFFFGFYGGADGKALIAIAVLVPYFLPRVGIYPVAPLIVLTNGVLISIILPIAMFIFNLIRLARKQAIFEGFKEPVYKKMLACLLGYKQMGKPRAFQFSMEKTEDESGEAQASDTVKVKKFDFSMMRDDFETKTGTWVTPGIPLLVFFTAGYFVLLFYGDLVIGLIQFFFRIVPHLV